MKPFKCAFPKISEKKHDRSPIRASFIWVSLFFTLGLSAPGLALEPFGLDPTGRSGEQPRFLEQLPESKTPAPPLPILPPASPLSPSEKPGGMPPDRFLVKKIRLSGNTVFSGETLSGVTVPYENRVVSAEELETLRRALTLFYVERGYLNSGAVIPDQKVSDGDVRIDIVEGELTQIEVENNRWLRDRYIADRLRLGAGPPLNVTELENRLKLLQQDPRISRFHAELKPGLRPGQSTLDVNVEEKSPFRVRLTANNYQSPSVGAERGLITLEDLSLTGNGDPLTLSIGRSEGLNPQIYAGYSLPITARDTLLILEYRRNDFGVVTPPFDALNVSSESEIFGVTLKHPLYRTLEDEVNIAVTGERLHNQTFLLGGPFSFSEGADDGESTVEALRLTQEWTHRTPFQMIGFRSRFSIGLDVADATRHEDSNIPDGRFLAWLGQVQWARRLGIWDSQVIIRTDLQLSDDPLLPIEQIAVGGRYSVRGYRENQMVMDNALISSLEFRIPLAQNRSWADTLWLVPFIDYGRAWYTDGKTPDPRHIASAGLGLIWELTLGESYPIKPQMEIFWGKAFRKIEADTYDLQNDGIHFQFSVAAF